MKILKKIGLLAVGAVAIISAAAPQQASAKGLGEMFVGVSTGVATYNTGCYMNLDLQYTIVPHVRIAPEVGCVFRNKGRSAFDISLDVHFPFRIVKAVNLYPLVGLTYNNWNLRDSGNCSRIGANFGAGAELYLTDYLKVFLQGKYSAMADTDGGYIGVGIGYVF